MAKQRMGDAQRKAMFARLAERISEHTSLKKAAIGGAVALAGTALALKYPGMRTRALAVASGGLATATGYGHSAYEHAKQQQKLATEQLHTAGKQLKAVGAYHKQQALHLARNIPVEDIAAHGVDLPFQWVEGILGHHIDKRVANLEKLASSRMQQLQTHVTGRAARKARGLHSRLFPGAVAHPLGAPEPRTKLRRTAETMKWDKALTDYMHTALIHGHQGVPTEEEVDRHLIAQRIPVTPHNRLLFRKLVMGSHSVGTHFTMKHYFG